jgi:hypothetical protein
MRRRLPVQAEAVGKDNVDKVTQLFIKGTFAGVFCNIHLVSFKIFSIRKFKYNYLNKKIFTKIN